MTGAPGPDDARFLEALTILRDPASPLADLDRALLGRLVEAARPCGFQPQQALLKQGAPGDSLILMLEGSADALVRGPGGEPERVASFGPGDVIGEMSLITEEPRTADVVASTPVRALQLAAAAFHELAARHPELRVLLTNVVADRLGRATYDGLLGKDVGGYRILRCVGRGGMGIVYEATRSSTGETVAMKMMNHRLLYQPEALRRFHREAETLMSLRHDSIARLYDCFAAYKTHFLIMEFCSGVTLHDLIGSRGSLPEPTVRRIVGQLALALGYVHGRGLVHRDLKPANVMLTGSGLVKLLDFGLARPDITGEAGDPFQAPTQALSLAITGTPRYMAPEQFGQGPTDRRVDYYALASVAFEALSGRPIAAASDLLGVIQAKLEFELPPPSAIGRGISTEMHAWLASGLDHRPERRTVDLARLATWAGPLDPADLEATLSGQLRPEGRDEPTVSS